MTGRAANPLFNANRLKLGVFALNVRGGCAMTSAEGRFEPDWPYVREVVRMADAAGLEALAPIARWKGFGGSTDFNGSSFETFTWAAGVAASTEAASVFATSHVPVMHPVLAAKQMTTIDHISGGRFALNVVSGWYRPELEMFGTPLLGHDARYEYAAEWLDVVRQLWTSEEEFDFSGRYFTVRRGYAEPRPVQRPFPPIMCAGGSIVGRRFAAKYADLAFTNLPVHDHPKAKEWVDGFRALARREFGRELQVWIMAYVVCRPTEREAREYLNHYVNELGDWESARTFATHMGLPAHVQEHTNFNFVAGSGGHPLVGTPEQIVEELAGLAGAGVDGCLLSWVDYRAGLRQWIDEVLPLVEQAGLRCPRSTAPEVA